MSQRKVRTSIWLTEDMRETVRALTRRIPSTEGSAAPTQREIIERAIREFAAKHGVRDA
jgi:predicted DNA-binding protein